MQLTTIYLSVFENSQGVGHRVLSFIRTYLSVRSQQVLIDDLFSLMQLFEMDNSQGAVSGPVLSFTFYLLPLEIKFLKFNVNISFYADDKVLYLVYNNKITQQYFV